MADYYDPNSEYAPSDPTPAAPQPIINAPPIAPAIAPHPDRQYIYSTSAFQFDFSEIIRRVLKYLFEGLAVAFVAYYVVGRGRLSIRDVVILGITAAFIFAILDTFSPTVSLGLRFGAGFGIGQSLFGVGPLSGLSTTAIRPVVV